jgi:hypothetical protein
LKLKLPSTPKAFPCACESQDYRTNIRPLITLGFSGAEIRCRITPMKYGYARVSADGQSIDAQVRQLKAAGARHVFREVASGAKTDRAQLRRALAQLDAGDVLIVTRLDRAIDTRPHFRGARRPGRRFPIASRHMGRHHHAARPHIPAPAPGAYLGWSPHVPNSVTCFRRKRLVLRPM